MLIGLLLELLLFEGTEVIWLIRLGVIAALLAGVLKSQGWFVLLALQCSLFLREPRRTEMYFGVAPLLFCLTVLAIIAYAYLGRSFRTRLSVWIVEQLRPLLGMKIAPAGTTLIGNQAEVSPAWYWMKFIAIQFMSWFMVISLTMVALQRLPLTASMRSEWLRSSIENEFTAWPGATLLVVAGFLVVIFMEAGWRQMTAAQASSYLRGSFMLYHYSELRMIVLRRLKLKRVAASDASATKQLTKRAIDAPPRV